VEHVGHHDRGAVLGFNQQRAFGDDGFKRAFVRAIGGEERLVGEHEHGVLMAAEPAGEMAGIDNVQSVVPAESEEPFAQHTFAGALEAAEHDGGFGREVWFLHHVGEPAE
jgi:hypothetical protein